MEDLADILSNMFEVGVEACAVIGFLYLWKCIKDTREAEKEKLARYARGDYSQDPARPWNTEGQRPETEKARPPT